MPDTSLGKAFMKYELNTIVLAVAVHGRWIKVQEAYGGFCDRWIQVEDESGKRTVKPYSGSAQLYLVVDPTGATVRDKPTKPRIGAIDAEPASNIVGLFKPGQMVLAVGSQGPWVQVRKAFEPPGVHYDCGDEWILTYTPKWKGGGREGGSDTQIQTFSASSSSTFSQSSMDSYSRQSPMGRSGGMTNLGLSITGSSPLPRLPNVGERQSQTMRQQSQKNFSRLSKGCNRELAVNSHEEQQEVTYHLQLVDLVGAVEEKGEEIEAEVEQVKKKVRLMCLVLFVGYCVCSRPTLTHAAFHSAVQRSGKGKAKASQAEAEEIPAHHAGYRRKPAQERSEKGKGAWIAPVLFTRCPKQPHAPPRCGGFGLGVA
jgi:hypothetical protein